MNNSSNNNNNNNTSGLQHRLGLLSLDGKGRNGSTNTRSSSAAVSSSNANNVSNSNEQRQQQQQQDSLTSYYNSRGIQQPAHPRQESQSLTMDRGKYDYYDIRNEADPSSDASASDEDECWIPWFCSLRGNEFFCEVDEDYVQDEFNLTGLHTLMPYYDNALDMILDIEPEEKERPLSEEKQEIVEYAAEMLYGLIHARYIVTSRGMHAMYEKYRNGAFGRCPRVFCEGQMVLPVGLSDLPRNYTVKVFCPRCHELYVPKTRQASIDGAYFGTTFPHLFLMTHPELIPPRPNQNYLPRVYGFKINESSLYYRHREDPELAEANRQRRNRRLEGRK